MQVDTEALAQRALWFAQHALTLFGLMLGLLLLLTWVGWRLLRRDPLEGLPHWPTRPKRLVLGVILILLGALVFSGLAIQIGAGGALGQADQALADALGVSFAGPALKVFAAFTHLGDTATLTVMCIGLAAALVVAGRNGLALGWVTAVAGNGLLNQALKDHFGRVRPLQVDALFSAQGLSFPSGHSSGAVVAYGMLAYLALRLLHPRWHLAVLLSALVLILTIGTSRVLLRVHFASDVLAGFASGTAWLALCVTCMELLRGWRRSPA